MHIVPSSKIPFPKVPLDVMYTTKNTFTKKQDKRINDDDDNIAKTAEGHESVHDRDDEARSKQLTMIDEFPFEHAISPIENGEFTVEGLRYVYGKLYSFMNLSDNADIGITLILTPNWMFLAPIYQPYHKE